MPLTADLFSRMVGRIVSVVRESCVGPRCLNQSYAAELEKKGNTVNVPYAGPVAVRNVVPNVVHPATPEATGGTVPVSLDYHKEAPFTLTEKDLSGFGDDNSFVMKQLDQAARSIANEVDSTILALYQDIPWGVGTPGTAPFATSTLQLQQAEQVLITNVAPVMGKKIILDPFAHANALGLQVFQNNQAYGADTIREGRIKRALGYDWSWSQNLPYHTRGVATGTPLTDGSTAIGATSVVTDGWTASAAILKKGDIITFAGSTMPYVVTADVTSSGAGAATIPIASGYLEQVGIRSVIPDNTAITVVASHRVNLALHPDMGAFASRILDEGKLDNAAGYDKTWPDPVSGLVLRVKVQEQYYQLGFSVSCLWGVKMIRPEYGCRVFG